MLQALTEVPGQEVYLIEAELSAFSFFFLKIYLFIICKYTEAVFRHTRRGHQISLSDISPLSDLGLVKIFSQSVGGLFVLLIVSFALQKLQFYDVLFVNC